MRLELISFTFVFLSCRALSLDDNFTSEREVHLLNGTVVGDQILVQNKTVLQFLSIPFAEPPIGPLRFSRPQPLKHGWKSPLIADQPPNRCLQIPFNFGFSFPDEVQPKLSEDCLYLNIWTPSIKPIKRFPVMVWIHGGAFVNGASFPLYDGRVLSALGEVVVVTIQYRLGVLGFLRLDADLVPGNWALFDQQLALRWIHESVEQFGGDRNKITIFGGSAGGAAVSLHLLHTDSRRYFQQAIVQSGAATNPRHFNADADATKEIYLRIAKEYLWCSEKTTEKLLECLRRIDGESILRAQTDIALSNPSFAVWRPILDGHFFKQTPEEILSAGSLEPKNVIVGVNEDEGGMFVYRIMKNYLHRHNFPNLSEANVNADVLRAMLSQALPNYPKFPHRMPLAATKVLHQLTVSAIEPSNGELNMRRFSEKYGQFVYYCGANRFIDAYKAISNSSVYYYEYVHRSSFSTNPKWIGATHGDELFYIFGLSRVYKHLSNFTNSEDEDMIDIMIKNWSNFAWTGHPGDTAWPGFTIKNKEIYRIGSSPQHIIYGLHREECALWDHIMPLLVSIENGVN